MAIKYLPTKLLNKIAPESKIKKLVAPSLTLKKAALSFISDVDFLSKPTIQRTALKVIKGYRERFEEEKEEGTPSAEAKEDALNDKKLLVNRVQNEVILQIAAEIKDTYRGEFYTWLPSSAEVPDPLHALNYGRKFQIGKGEMPGDRYGCKCGMLIRVPETKLDL